MTRITFGSIYKTTVWFVALVRTMWFVTHLRTMILGIVSLLHRVPRRHADTAGTQCIRHR